MAAESGRDQGLTFPPRGCSGRDHRDSVQPRDRAGLSGADPLAG
ncbi:hypothetical protein ACFFX0_32615 [Citricoccus parietis]|uniref:Uncharacterized protein n=1 Tax=Citricoccus parietis TaxID=592307 RepID=A0ABV5G9R9_9MICC